MERGRLFKRGHGAAPHLPDQHGYLFSCDAVWEWIMAAAPLKVNRRNLPSDSRWPREAAARRNTLEPPEIRMLKEKQGLMTPLRRLGVI